MKRLTPGPQLMDRQRMRMLMEIRPLLTLMTWRHQNPGLQTTRDEFESQLKRFSHRIASTITNTVVLTLPKGCLMKCEAPPELVDKSGVIQYDEFPADLRDQIWDAACTSAKRTFERRKRASDAAKSGLSGGQEATSTPPPT